MPPANRLADLGSAGHLTRAMIEDYEFLVLEHGLTHEAAAQRVGVAPTTIERRYSRARRPFPSRVQS